MQIPLVDLYAQYQAIKHEVKAAFEEVLENMQLFLGPQLEELLVMAAEQRRVLMIRHMFEYNSTFNEFRKFVQSGNLRKIYCTEAEWVNLGLFRSDNYMIWGLAPHNISSKVQAHAHLKLHIHDLAHLDLEFVEGVTAHINVSWLHPYVLALMKALIVTEEVRKMQVTRLKQGAK